MHPKISIILPFFNAEKYLPKCLKSILAQTFTDFELICVDDASTDNSLKIVKEFAAKDDRIKYFSIEKSHQGIARNKAVEIAKGDFIGFVDADDFIEAEMFEKLADSIVNHNSDFAICYVNAIDESSGKTVKFDYFEREKQIFEKFNSEFIANKNITENLAFLSVVPWNKLFKSSFLKSNNIKFYNSKIHEDIPFGIDAFLCANKISVRKEKLYNYLANRSNSTMNSIRIENVFVIFDVLHFTDDLIYSKFKSDVIQENFNLFKIKQLINSLNGVLLNENFSKEIKKEFFKRSIAEFRLLKSEFGLSLQERIQFYLICSNHFSFYRVLLFINTTIIKLKPNLKRW